MTDARRNALRDLAAWALDDLIAARNARRNLIAWALDEGKFDDHVWVGKDTSMADVKRWVREALA